MQGPALLGVAWHRVAWPGAARQGAVFSVQRPTGRWAVGIPASDARLRSALRGSAKQSNANQGYFSSTGEPNMKTIQITIAGITPLL